MHPGGAGADHRFHQFVGVEHAAEARLGVGDDRREVVNVAGVARIDVARPLDLVGALERVVDALDHFRHGIDGIQRLVRVHGRVAVVIRRHLPAGQVDGLDAGLDLLHGLAAGQGAEAVHIRLVVHEPPQLLRAATGEGLLDGEAAAQADHIFGGVGTLDALPAGILGPVLFQGGNGGFAVGHFSVLDRLSSWVQCPTKLRGRLMGRSIGEMMRSNKCLI